MAKTYSAGVTTAYGAAKRGGYTGTYEQFCAEQASFAQNAQQVRQDKESVEQTVTTFSNTTVPAAVQSVTDEGTEQVGLVTNAGTAAVGNVNDAGTTQVGNVNSAGQTQVGNVNNAGTTQVGNVTAEGNTQVGRVQAKGDEVIASIPSDYSDLAAEVSDLNRHFNYIANTIKADIPTESSAYYYFDYAVVAGKSYKFTNNTTANMTVATCDASNTRIETISSNLAKDGSIIFTATQVAVKIRVWANGYGNLVIEDTDAVLYHLREYVDSNSGDIAVLQGSVSNNKAEIDSVKVIAVDTCKNLMNPERLTITGQYYSSGNGTHDDNTGFRSFDAVISVEPNTAYTYSVDGTAGRMATCVQLDAAGNKVGGGYNVGSPFTTADNCASLLISLYVADITKAYQLEAGSTPTSYVQYYAPRLKRASNLAGKKICSFGDSLAAMDDGNRNATTWIDILCNYFDAVPYNRGIGGSCVTSVDKDSQTRVAYSYVDAAGDAGELRLAYTTQHTFANYPTEINPCMNQVDRTNTIPTDTDIVIINAGTNDYGSTTLADFEAAYKTMLDNIYTRVPNALIVICAMPFRHLYDDSTDEGTRTAYNNYRARIEKVANDYGYRFINLQKVMGINKNNYAAYMNDQVHYNTPAGRKLYAETIGYYLDSICYM